MSDKRHKSTTKVWRLDILFLDDALPVIPIYTSLIEYRVCNYNLMASGMEMVPKCVFYFCVNTILYTALLEWFAFLVKYSPPTVKWDVSIVYLKCKQNRTLVSLYHFNKLWRVFYLETIRHFIAYTFLLYFVYTDNVYNHWLLQFVAIGYHFTVVGHSIKGSCFYFVYIGNSYVHFLLYHITTLPHK